VDVQADAASKVGTSPQDEARGAFAFAGLVFDLDACTLKRESGEAHARRIRPVARICASARPGPEPRFSARRRSRPAQCSVRSQRRRDGRAPQEKIEPDPKQPSVIQTVPGEGYRFTAPLSPRRRAAEAVAATTGASPRDTAIPPPPAIPRTWRALWPVLAAVVALCLVAAVTAIQWRPVRQEAAPRLSIVVLPFENMSGDKEQDYFADGITDDLITDLSRLQDSFVISRGTAFTYKGKPIDAKQIGRELGVRYVLEGSVRRLGEQVEVNAQLISTETGAQVWADRFEGERSKLGELQVEVVARLARSLNVELIKAEALRAARERPNNPDAADLAMRASARFYSNADSSKSVNSDVIDLDERALTLDPQNERAMTDLAMAVDDRVTMRWSADPAGDLARAEKLADSALALQPNDARAHMAKAEVSFNKQQWTAAISQGEAALADDPNYALARAEPSFWNIFLGHAEDSFAGIETALRLSPRDPDVSWWRWFRCHAHTHLAQWEQAVEWCGKSIASGNQSFFPFVDLAAANAWAGHDKEAKEAAAELQKVYPGFTVQTWAGINWSDDPTVNAQYQRIVEGLRKAGVPEGEKKEN
jgi:TolB-like protein